jgi:serine/threonine protein phosphatase PrpC
VEAAVKKLVDTANANGGIDNVTVILAQYQPG